MNKIYSTLQKLGLTSKRSRIKFSKKTRDKEKQNVWLDKKSGVIYIDDYYVGDNEYELGNYRDNKKKITGDPSFERLEDANRRISFCKKFIKNKTILEFGCGNGDFLFLAKRISKEITGIELQTDYRKYIQSKKIKCFRNFEELEKKKFDVILSFHVVEHLPDPINEIKKLRTFLSSKGKIIIEVPHANDFLLTHAKVESFKDFTLWSQHLILHTKDSLFKLLKSVGFKKINIDGIQRYNIANHMNWLINNKSGGHKSYLAKLENRQIKKEYANFLSKLNANDTLIAIADK